jgi:tricorn protease
MTPRNKTALFFLILLFTLASAHLFAQGTRLLRQPAISTTQIAFEYGGDIWVSPLSGGEAQRITSTAAVESDPHFSPDGQWLAFSSNRSGIFQVYIVSSNGGEPKQLTWYPASSFPRSWSPDGKSIVYASSRETAPVDFNRLWTVR